MALEDRRRLLKFLAGSPLLASVPAEAWQEAAVLENPKDALNVMEFESAARKALPPAHYGYMATGVDDDFTLRANHEAYRRIQLRPRRLVDIREASMRTTLFGTDWESPIFICPCGYHRAFHPEGEVATARAARARKSLMLLSTVTTTPVEDVNREYGGAVWYQLYATSSWAITEKLVKRAEAAGCPVLVWTIDLMAGRNTETQTRLRRLDTRDCTSCHGPGGPGGAGLRRYPMFAGLDVTGVGLAAPALTWDTVERLKKLTTMKVVLKGIETREDAELACQHGADGIIVSNHGGRAEESGRATIECLPEVVEAARGRVPVMIDGGIRRGSDAFKALALGAKAVGIGRPYLWGLAAFGQPGIERVIEILRTELSLVMRQCGTRSIQEITRASVTG
ncbi:MAG TPA: alpha-hydroxy acid oxidase [Candidatus Acidoferrales bacterium]|nr:alpha-hydroxy acid oxidase [Candidatus Acidoferrales bacterium]